MRVLLITARENAALRGRVLERTYDRVWVCVGQSWEGLQKYKFSLDLMFSESGSSYLTGFSINLAYREDTLESYESCTR